MGKEIKDLKVELARKMKEQKDLKVSKRSTTLGSMRSMYSRDN